MYQVVVSKQMTELEWVKQIMQEEFHGEWKVLEAKDREELFLILEEKKPEALILPISTGKMSGLEILRTIRKINKKLKICVCSSYNSGDVVTEVVHNGVDAYLCTPMKKYQLVQTIEKITSDLEAEKIKWIEKKGHENYLKQIHSVLEQGFLYSVLFSAKSEKVLSEYCDALGVVYQGCIFNLEIKSDGNETEIFNKDDILCETIKTIMKQYGRCVVGPRIMDRFVVYMGWTQEKFSQEEIKSYQVQISKTIKENMKTELGLDVFVEAGGVYPIKEIYQSYQESIHELYSKKEGQRTLVQRSEKYSSHRDYVNKVYQLMDAIKFGRNDSGQIFAEMISRMDYLKYEAKVNKILQLIILCCHVAYLEGENEMEFLDCTEFLKEIANSENVENWAYRKFEYIVHVVNEHHGKRTSNTVKRAIEYIEKNYTNEISLEEVSRHVGISPQHFSKIFKLETGSNYVDWIAKMRIEQAKNYLDEGNHTIKEICFLVGYKDPNYFSRIFKKMVGMSPSAYIRHVQD